MILTIIFWVALHFFCGYVAAIAYGILNLIEENKESLKDSERAFQVFLFFCGYIALASLIIYGILFVIVKMLSRIPQLGFVGASENIARFFRERKEKSQK